MLSCVHVLVDPVGHLHDCLSRPLGVRPVIEVAHEDVALYQPSFAFRDENQPVGVYVTVGGHGRGQLFRWPER